MSIIINNGTDPNKDNVFTTSISVSTNETSNSDYSYEDYDYDYDDEGYLGTNQTVTNDDDLNQLRTNMSNVNENKLAQIIQTNNIPIVAILLFINGILLLVILIGCIYLTCIKINQQKKGAKMLYQQQYNDCVQTGMHYELSPLNDVN